jgi:hypothetical protein
MRVLFLCISRVVKVFSVSMSGYIMAVVVVVVVVVVRVRRHVYGTVSALAEGRVAVCSLS